MGSEFQIMNETFKLLFLGTGTSAGVPMVGCDCRVCKSADPHNHRQRSSVYISLGDFKILIDTSPDFREQAIRHNIRKIDALFITHAHVDHLFGLDDVRRINTVMGDVSIPLYAASETLDDIRRIFNYIFRTPDIGTYRPKIELVPADAPFMLNDGKISVTPFPVVHGSSATRGFKIEFLGRKLVYMPDCHSIHSDARKCISGADVLILDTLRYKPHVTHLTLDESLEIITDVKPARAYLTHLCHDFDHDDLTRELLSRGFSNVIPAYDGLEIEC